jgi:hypothetical protein
MIKKRLLTDRGAGMQLSNVFDPLTWEKGEIVRLLRGVPGTQYQEADDAGKELMREWIKGLLHTNEITVTFTKADGTDREMLCTLNGTKIPLRPLAPTTSTAPVDGIVRESKKPRKAPDPHSIRVYDLEKQEWRSFRFDRLKKVTTTLDFNK